MGSTCSIDLSHARKSRTLTNPAISKTPPGSQKISSNKSFLNTDFKPKEPSKRDSIQRSHSQKMQKSNSIEIKIKKFNRILFNVSARSSTEFPSSDKKLPKIPENIHWKSWKTLLSNEHTYLKAFYSSYMLEVLPWSSEYEIRKDLARTFPVEKFFQNENVFGSALCEGQEKLFNVLKALTLHFPNIGYCQGMNFLVGFLLLMNGGNEIETFSFFVKLSLDSKFFLIYLYEEKFPLLYFLIYVFKAVASKKIPEIISFLKQMDFPDEAWLTKWYLSFFLNGFPLNQVEKFWDYILKNGVFSLISLTISIIHNLKEFYLHKEKIDFMNLINNLSQNNFINVKKCLKDAEKTKLTKKMIGKMAEEYIRLNPKLKRNFCLIYFRSFTKNKRK